MRAVTYAELGGPEVVHLSEVPEPHAGPGEVRVRVAAAGINPVDWKTFRGLMPGAQAPAAPTVLGWDASGVVDEVGEGVAGVAVGDDVFGFGHGTQAEHVVLTDWVAKPPALDWSVAAAAPSALETSERVLRLVDVQPGQTLVVAGGAGGVGAVLVQMAVAAGVRVIASAGADNQGYLAEIGAVGVAYGEGFVDRVLAAAPAGVDAVADVAGKTPVADLLALAPRPDKVVSIANPDLAGAGGVLTWGSADERHPREALTRGTELLATSQVVITVRTFPLERAREAYETSLSGHVRGKLVLLP